jgi:hypothetical protein
MMETTVHTQSIAHARTRLTPSKARKSARFKETGGGGMGPLD